MAQTNLVICPNCGFENIEGTDSCENCQSDLRSLDVPVTAQQSSESELTLPLAEVQLSRPVTIESGASLKEALDLMHSAGTEALVVIDAGVIRGIFTERDILKRVAGQALPPDTPITSVMTRDPVVLRETDSMAVAMNKMGVGGFRHIPLARGDDVIAMVTVRDVLKWVLGQYLG